ncbi:MAG: FAD-binding protein [Acidimicrobiales bacterium]|nr:FAD-binding protein [Acidimicrobiales bacterium]
MTGRSALEAFASEVGADGPVAVVGGRTAWDVGGEPDADVRLVAAPVGVVEYEPAEMTVRVGAGTPVAALHGVLAEAGQITALPSGSDGAGATVGGVLAVGRSGLDQLRWGPVRDALLEARYVSAEGRLVKAGGPTVKNVSGYDLCRVLVGSLGTLGLLGEVVLRTRPAPPCSRWFAGAADPWSVRSALYRPAAVLWDGSTTWVWLQGHEVDVEAEAAVLGGLGFSPVDGPPVFPPHRHSMGAAALRTVAGPFLAEIGTGLVHREDPPAPAALPDAVVALNRRVKAELDPTGRLNPGREPLQAMA